MSLLGNFLFLSSAIAFGQLLFILFAYIFYRVVYKESQEDGHEMTVDEVPIDEKTGDMEEVPLEI